MGQIMGDVQVVVGGKLVIVNERVVSKLQRIAELDVNSLNKDGEMKYRYEDLGRIELARELCDEMRIEYIAGEDIGEDSGDE